MDRASREGSQTQVGRDAGLSNASSLLGIRGNYASFWSWRYWGEPSRYEYRNSGDIEVSTCRREPRAAPIQELANVSERAPNTHSQRLSLSEWRTRTQKCTVHADFTTNHSEEIYCTVRGMLAPRNAKQFTVLYEYILTEYTLGRKRVWATQLPHRSGSPELKLGWLGEARVSERGEQLVSSRER